MSATSIPAAQLLADTDGRPETFYSASLKRLDPQSNAASLFSDADAWVDRCDLGLTIPFMCASPEAFDDVASLWCDQTGDADVAGDAPWLLATPGLRSKGVAYTLRINPGWSFSGGGKIFYNEQRNKGRIELSIQINPSRWIRYLPELDILTLHQMPAALKLRSRIRSAPFGLDGNDNFFLSDRLGPAEPETRRQHRQQLLGIYLDALSDFIITRLYPADNDNPHRLVSRDDLTEITSFRQPAMRQAEIYWDLYHPDAPLAVSAIKRALETVSAHVEVRTVIDTAVRQDAQRVTLFLTKEIHLRVYAKCIDRVRFEIIYKSAQHLAQTIHRAGYGSQSALSERLGGLCSDAEDRIAKTWDAIRSHLDYQTEPGSFIDYSVACAQARIGEEANKVLRILANTQGIADAGTSSAVIQSLLRVGILDAPTQVRHGGGRRYPLQQRWCRMFDELKRLHRQ